MDKQNPNKESKQKNTKNTNNFISDIIKDSLKDWLKDLDFSMSVVNNQLELYVKEVEVRNDLLKKFGIPLDLTKGKVDQIKVTVNKTKINLLTNINVTYLI